MRAPCMLPSYGAAAGTFLQVLTSMLRIHPRLAYFSKCDLRRFETSSGRCSTAVWVRRAGAVSAVRVLHQTSRGSSV
jgi:hypothetical protein